MHAPGTCWSTDAAVPIRADRPPRARGAQL
jgi:hypothetical protein